MDAKNFSTLAEKSLIWLISPASIADNNNEKKFFGAYSEEFFRNKERYTWRYATKGRWGIVGLTVNNVHRAYNTFNTDHTAAVNRVERKVEKKDTVEISDTSREFNTILKAVMDTPDLRGDKVDDIKSRVALGNYNVSSSAIANKILGEYYKNHPER